MIAATVCSRDVPPVPDQPDGDAEVGDLQTAAVLVAAGRHGIRAAAGLVVGAARGRRLEDEPLESRLLELARIAAGVLEVSTSGGG